MSQVLQLYLPNSDLGQLEPRSLSEKCYLDLCTCPRRRFPRSLDMLGACPVQITRGS